ncbi:MAG: hypothetical protein ACO3DT_17340, partial [Gammaproteobacteria bacterium]
MRNAKILRLNKAGTPIDWITREEAATLVVKDQVVWALGENAFEIRGGINRLGRQSVLSLPSILASDGSVKLSDFVPPLVNGYLFRRDQYLCMYCGGEFNADNLSRACNLRVPVPEWKDEVVFLRKVVEGAADRSFGIQVAPLAGLPRA